MLSYTANAEHVKFRFCFSITHCSRCSSSKLCAECTKPADVGGCHFYETEPGRGPYIQKKRTVKGWYYIRVLIHCRVCTYACTEGDVRLVLDAFNLFVGFENCNVRVFGAYIGA